MAKIVAENFSGALPQVGQDAEARFQLEVEGIDDHAVGTGAADAEEIFFSFPVSRPENKTRGRFLFPTPEQVFRRRWEGPKAISVPKPEDCRAPRAESR